jgi:hypothetical protein
MARHMLRSLVLALALIVVVAPAANAKKHRPAAHKTKKVRVTKHAPTRVAAAVEVPATPPAHTVATPPAPAPAAIPPAAEPVARGPAVSQAADDEVPGSRMKKR